MMTEEMPSGAHHQQHEEDTIVNRFTGTISCSLPFAQFMEEYAAQRADDRVQRLLTAGTDGSEFLELLVGGVVGGKGGGQNTGLNPSPAHHHTTSFSSPKGSNNVARLLAPTDDNDPAVDVGGVNVGYNDVHVNDPTTYTLELGWVFPPGTV